MQPSSDYREPFSIVVNGFTTNEFGDQIEREQTVFRGFARVSNLTSREFWDAAAQGKESTIKLFTRWHKELETLDTKKAHVVFRGCKLNIYSLDNVNSRNDQVIIRAKEVE